MIYYILFKKKSFFFKVFKYKCSFFSAVVKSLNKASKKKIKNNNNKNCV